MAVSVLARVSLILFIFYIQLYILWDPLNTVKCLYFTHVVKLYTSRAINSYSYPASAMFGALHYLFLPFWRFANFFATFHNSPTLDFQKHFKLDSSFIIASEFHFQTLLFYSLFFSFLLILFHVRVALYICSCHVYILQLEFQIKLYFFN